MRRAIRIRQTGVMAIAVAAVATFQASPARAQHASDNPVKSADDAFGLKLGLESVGIYSPGSVRGFSPISAGNVRIDGMYFDLRGPPSDRVVEGSTIHVGVGEIGYPFPAPTGIADYNLRKVGGDKSTATVIASVGPYGAWGVSIDGSIPLGNQFVLPIGISTKISTQSSEDGAYYPGLTSRVTSIGATPQWTPNSHVTVRALIDWQQTSAAKVLPEFFAAGDFLPPLITKGYVAQNWARARKRTMNLGGLVNAEVSKNWLMRAGGFRSTNKNLAGFADVYTGIQPNGQSDHVVVAFRDQEASSTSGEVRLIGTFHTGNWRQQVIFAARGHNTTSHFGGQDVVDLGPALISDIVQAPEPNFVFSARTLDRAKLVSVGAAYRADWRSQGVVEIGVQKEVYRETANVPGTPQSEISAHPWRAYANGAFAVTPQLTLYGGYTQGLENSGIAPNFARNSGAVLPASLTWQADFGARYVVTPRLKLIAGVFEIQKPYFNLDTSNIDRQLGVQQGKGVELSVAGEVTRNFDVNIGALAGKVGITGPDLAAEGVGSIAVGQPHLMYVASANYALPRWPAASIDVRFVYIGTAPESVDNRVFTAPATILNIGARCKFTVLGKKSGVRLQVQNVLANNLWQQLSTPGVFQWPGPRRIFAYLTTDF